MEMVDYTPIVLNVTSEERERIETQARERGYEDPSEYLRALVEADAEEDDDDGAFDPVAFHERIKRGLRQAMRGEGTPIDDVWDMLHDE